MEFGLTEEQIMARDMIREFADREMAPVIPGYERRGEFPAPIVARLGELGVRRISVGSALARVAWGAFMRAAKGIQETGTFDGLAGLAPFAELNQIFDPEKRP